MKDILRTLEAYAGGDIATGTLLLRLGRIPLEAYARFSPDVPYWAWGALCYGAEQRRLLDLRRLDRDRRPDQVRMRFSGSAYSFADDLSAVRGQGPAAWESLMGAWKTRVNLGEVPLASVGYAQSRVRDAGRVLSLGVVRVPLLSSWWETGALEACGVPRRGQVSPGALGACGFHQPGVPLAYGEGDLLVTLYRPSTGVYLTFGRGAPLSCAAQDGDVIVRCQRGGVAVQAVTVLGALHPQMQVLMT